MVTDLDVLLDDLIHQKDEWERARRVERETHDDREQRLCAAGARIRQLAVGRKRKVRYMEGITDIPDEKTPRKNARRGSSSAREDVPTCMVKIVETQKESEVKKLELQERRFKFELGGAKRETERLDCAQSVADRKKVLKKKRFELDKLEREDRSTKKCEKREDIREERRYVR